MTAREPNIISRRALRRIAIGVAVLAAVAVLAVALDATLLRRDARRAQAHLDGAIAVAEPAMRGAGSVGEVEVALDRALAQLAGADRSLAAARRRAGRLGPLLAVGARVPGWTEGLDELGPSLRAAHELVRAGLTLGEASRAVLVRVEAGADGDEPVSARVVAGFSEAEPAFAEALAAVERARAARRAVEAGELRGPLAAGGVALARFDERIDGVHENALLLAELPAALGAVLGMEGPRTYALLGQNSAELRPTGGFIGSMGLLTLDGGAIAVEDYRSSYAFDNPARGFPPMPAPMAAHLGGGGGWAIRDANWSPDFPTSARTLALMVARHQDVRVDGVIGVTTAAVGALLDALGPVAVEGIAEPVTAETWYRAAEQLIYFPEGTRAFSPDAERNKEAVLEPILKEVLRRVQGASPAELPGIVRALQSSVRRRELLFVFYDAAPADLARRLEADGRMTPPATGDVLALVDANLSYSKVGPYVQTSIEYEVWLDERGRASESRATVAYENGLARERAQDPRAAVLGLEWDAVARVIRPNPGVYGTYARLYIPRGSRLIDLGAEPARVATSEELGFLTLGRYESVPAGGRRSYRYAYQPAMPPESRTGEYRLLVIKQPGTTPALRVRIHAPAGVGMTAEAPLARDGDALVYQGALATNMTFQVTLDRPVP